MQIKYECIELDWANGVAPLADDLNHIGQRIINGDVVILKNVFKGEDMDVCKNAILDWKKDEAESNPDRLTTQKSWWRRDINTPSQTLHMFETFCFIFNEKTPESLSPIKRVFQTMEEVWVNLITKTEWATLENSGRELRPQVIYYPSGGGFFDYHVHDLAPQKIGLIVCMSKQGRDFKTGGTIFRDSDGVMDISDNHDIGDICLFRYDLDHAVAIVDEADTLDWSGRGRWTMVLPIM